MDIVRKAIGVVFVAMMVVLKFTFPGAEKQVAAVDYLNVSAGRASAYLEERRRELLRKELRRCVSGNEYCASSGWSLLFRATGGERKTRSQFRDQALALDGASKSRYGVAHAGFAYKFESEALKNVRVGALVGAEVSETSYENLDESRDISGANGAIFILVPTKKGALSIQLSGAKLNYEFKDKGAQGSRWGVSAGYYDSHLVNKRLAVRYAVVGGYSNTRIDSHIFNSRTVDASENTGLSIGSELTLDFPMRLSPAAVLVPFVSAEGRIVRDRYRSRVSDTKFDRTREIVNAGAGFRLLRRHSRLSLSYKTSVGDRLVKRRQIGLSAELDL